MNSKEEKKDLPPGDKDHPLLPPYKEGCTTIQLDNADLRMLVNLLSASKDVFAKVAINALDQQDSNSVSIYTMRAKLANAFAEKLAQHTTIGEPISRDIH